MSQSGPDLAEAIAGTKRSVRQCLWSSAANLALVTLVAARVYGII